MHRERNLKASWRRGCWKGVPGEACVANASHGGGDELSPAPGQPCMGHEYFRAPSWGQQEPGSRVEQGWGVRVAGSFQLCGGGGKPRCRCLGDASWFFRSQTVSSQALQSYSFRVWTPPPSEGQSRLSQEYPVSFASHQLSQLGLALLTFGPFRQDRPATTPQSPRCQTLSSEIHRAESGSTGRCPRY